MADWAGLLEEDDLTDFAVALVNSGETGSVRAQSCVLRWRVPFFRHLYDVGGKEAASGSVCLSVHPSIKLRHLRKVLRRVYGAPLALTDAADLLPCVSLARFLQLGEVEEEALGAAPDLFQSCAHLLPQYPDAALYRAVLPCVADGWIQPDSAAAVAEAAADSGVTQLALAAVAAADPASVWCIGSAAVQTVGGPGEDGAGSWSEVLAAARSRLLQQFDHRVSAPMRRADPSLLRDILSCDALYLRSEDDVAGSVAELVNGAGEDVRELLLGCVRWECVSLAGLRLADHHQLLPADRILAHVWKAVDRVDAPPGDRPRLHVSAAAVIGLAAAVAVTRERLFWVRVRPVGVVREWEVEQLQFVDDLGRNHATDPVMLDVSSRFEDVDYPPSHLLTDNNRCWSADSNSGDDAWLQYALPSGVVAASERLRMFLTLPPASTHAEYRPKKVVVETSADGSRFQPFGCVRVHNTRTVVFELPKPISEPLVCPPSPEFEL